MTTQPWTGRRLYLALRRAGVALSANGERLVFDALAGAVTPELRGLMKARKPELLAVVRGDYLRAALALVLDEPDPDPRNTLADWFDQRAGFAECEGGMSRGEAKRFAYVALCRLVEGGSV